MTPTPLRRRVKFKQRTPHTTHGNSRRAQRALVAALLAVGLGAPAAVLMRAVVRDGLGDPAGIARRLQGHVPENEPLLRLPSAAPVAAAAPARDAAARPAVGWSTPAPDAPVSRSWETPFVNGRTVALAPVAPLAAPAVRAALNVRDAGFAPAPVFSASARSASAPPPVGLHALTAPALASLVASAAGSAGESAPVSPLSPVTGAAPHPGPRTRLAAPNVVINNTFTWSGAAVAAGSPPSPNWNVGLNWVGNTAPPPAPGPTTSPADISYVPTPTAATATNVEQNYQINSLTFAAPVATVQTPGYAITRSGTAILSVGAGGITDGSTNAQTLALPVYATANQTFNVSAATGRLNLPGPTPAPSQSGPTTALYLQGQNRAVTVDGAGTTAITGNVLEGTSVVNGSLVKNGAGTLILAGNNAYSGGTVLNAGILDFQSSTALGTGTFTINGGALTNSNPGGFGFVNNAVTVTANFAHATGQNSLGLTGPVSLGAASRTVTSTDTGLNTLNFNGAISGGPGVGLTFVGSSANTFGYFSFAGTAANTYPGPTVVDTAELDLNKSGGAVAIAGNLTVQNGGAVFTSGRQLAAGTILTTNTGGQFNATGGFIAGSNETIAQLNGDATGTVIFGSQSLGTTLTVGQGSTASLLRDGVLSVGRPGGLTAAVPGPTGGALVKNTAGTLTLSHNNTYSGGTLVSAGALFANNVPASRSDSATGSGDVLVLNGARLGGGGSVGRPSTFNGEVTTPGSTVTIGGSPVVIGLADGPSALTVLNPGILGAGATPNGTAILTVNGNLTLTSTAQLETELGGATAGTGYDQIRVGGAIALGGDLSLATVNGFKLTVGQTFYILDGISAAAVTSGTFANVTPETSTTGLVSFGVNQFRVNYAASDPNDPSATAGNDVSVTVLSVPEPGSLALAALGAAAGLGAWVRRRRAA